MVLIIYKKNKHVRLRHHRMTFIIRKTFIVRKWPMIFFPPSNKHEKRKYLTKEISSFPHRTVPDPSLKDVRNYAKIQGDSCLILRKNTSSIHPVRFDVCCLKIIWERERERKRERERQRQRERETERQRKAITNQTTTEKQKNRDQTSKSNAYPLPTWDWASLW